MAQQPTSQNRLTMLWIGAGAALLILTIVLASRPLGLDVWAVDGMAAAIGSPDDTSRVVVVGELDNRLAESSGVAVSRGLDGLIWTHNDQGNALVLYATDLSGGVHRTIALTDMSGQDLEDIAAGPCPSGVTAPGDCLYLADTGDNEEVRTSYTVWVVPEPADSSPTEQVSAPAARLDFRYVDGAADTEALALEPQGDLLVVTKGNDGTARAYRLPRSAFRTDVSASGPITEAEFVATLPLRVQDRTSRITGAAMSPDGDHLAVRTHRDVYLFERGDLDAVPTVCPIGDRQPQGEGVDFLDGERLILTSEAPARRLRPAPILRLRCPD